jgi:hypothetical protein
VLFFWGALSDERTVLSFVYAAGPRQCRPLGLVTIIYCPRFETSLFVASYDSQAHGGGIRPRLHTGKLSSILCHAYNSSAWTSRKQNYSSVVYVYIAGVI